MSTFSAVPLQTVCFVPAVYGNADTHIYSQLYISFDVLRTLVLRYLLIYRYWF